MTTLFPFPSESIVLNGSVIGLLIYFFILCRTCSNSSSWVENTMCLEALTDSLVGNLRKVHDVVKKTETSPSNCSFEFLLGSSNDISMRTDMMKFLRNATLLSLTAFPRNYILEEAALVAEELLNTKMDTCSITVTPCRALAKSLVKSNRQVLLCLSFFSWESCAFCFGLLLGLLTVIIYE